MLRKLRRYYEADSGTNPVTTITETPQAVTEVAGTVPETTVKVAHDAVEVPHAAIHQTLQGLTTATEALTNAANSLAESARAGKEQVEEVVTTPIEASHEQAQEVAPEIVEPPKPKFIRRNGRKVKR
jgi:hypothetical protein